MGERLQQVTVALICGARLLRSRGARAYVRFGQKQTLQRILLMSALPPKGDIGQRNRHVSFVPKVDVART